MQKLSALTRSNIFVRGQNLLQNAISVNIFRRPLKKV